jgi:hypothetical protein
MKKIKPVTDFTTDVTAMQEFSERRHQEVIAMIEALSDASSSDRASSVRKLYTFERLEH